MKVTGYTPPDLSTSKTAQNNTPKTQPDAAQTAKSAASNSGVAVLVSSSRTAAKEPVNQASDVDTDKVAAMKAAIADGSFTVNPEAIASKLLTSAQEMLGTQQQ